MSMWDSIASGLQDNGGVGMSDPYFSDTPTKSSWSGLAQSLISAGAGVGESFIANANQPNSLSTGYPYTPPPYNPQTYGMTVSGEGNSNMLEYVLIGGAALLLGIFLLRR